MEILKPYDTTTGKLINAKPIVSAIMDYIVRNGIKEELAYEFYLGDVELYIITGKNEEEKLLPVFDQPLFFKNIRNQPSIALDFRPYVNYAMIKNGFVNLRDVMRDKNSGNFLLLLALLYLRTENGVSDIKPIMTHTITALSLITSAAVSKTTVLNAPDKVSLEIAAAIYGYKLFFPNNVINEDVEKIVGALSKIKFSFPIDRRILMEKVREASTINKDLEGLNLLKGLIDLLLPSDISELITTNSIFSVLDNSWYGPGATRSVYIGFESVPMLIALLYAIGASTMFKSSKIAAIVEAKKRNINVDDLVHYLNNTFVKKEVGKLL